MTAWLDLIRSSGKTVSRHTPAPKPHGSRAAWSDAPKIRTIFMGTSGFAATLLAGLVEKKYNIVCVITKPDKPVGREQTVTESPVKKTAVEHNLSIKQPLKFDEETVRNIKELKPDVIIIAAYGKLLPKAILETPGFGCVNVHASLLPRWRGASPIQNALLAGDTETGVTLMLMNEGMDTGDILAQKKIEILKEDTKETLTHRLTAVATDTLLETLPLWIKRTITPVPQDHTSATLCQLIEREDGHIIWTDSAESIFNRFRALSPWPGIFAFWKRADGLVRLKLHRVSYQKQSPQSAPSIGQVFETGEKIGVHTGEGVVFLEEVQLEGKTRMSIKEFLLGNKDLIGGFLQ